MKYPSILQLDETGQPNIWSSWQSAVTYKAKDMVLWSLGEVEFIFHGGRNRNSGNISTITIPSIIAVKNKTMVRHRTPPLSLRSLFARDLHTCVYCGNVYREDKLTKDHIIPVNPRTLKGRTVQSKFIKENRSINVWKNLITACKPCNNYKENYLLEEIGVELLYLPYTPSKAESMILSNRNILKEQTEFLKGFVSTESRVHLK